MRRADIISAGILFVFGLATIFLIIPKYVAGSAVGGDLSPAFMPYVAAIAGTVAVGILFITKLVRASGTDEPSPLSKSSWYFVGCSVAVLMMSFLLLDFLGYLPGAAAMVAGFMILGRTNIKVVLGTMAAFPVALWLLFDKLLGFPLP